MDLTPELMMPESVACVAYARVSTEHQAGEVYTSLADQEAAVQELAKRLGVTVGRVFRDAGASGANVEGRPAFLELLSWCEEHRRPARSRGYVLVLNDSRFGRFEEPEEATYWRHHLHRLGWTVRFCEGDDVEGDFRTVVRAIGSVQASEYRRNLIANTRRGMRGAAEQGFWTRRAPFGYRRMVAHPPGAERVLEPGEWKATNEKVRLTPHPEESSIVRWTFELYAGGGESLGSLAERLKKRVPGRRWSRTVVNHMLRNDAYRGAVVGGRRRDGDSVRYGCEDAHEAIVPPRLWASVQRRLEANAIKGPAVQTSYLLTGLLACVHCQEVYTGGGGGRSRTNNPERSHRRFYRDSGGVSGICPGRIGTVMRHLVDDRAVELIAATVTEPRVRKRIEREVDRVLDDAPGLVSESDAQLRAARAKVERKRERLTAAVAEGVLLPREAAGQLEKIRAELADLEGRRHALRFRENRTKGLRRERDRLLDVLADFPALAARTTGAKLRELVEPWIGRATFDKVTRELVLGIRPVPALASLGPLYSRGQTGRNEVGLILRSASLLQPGHEHHMREAHAAVAEDLARRSVG